MGIIFVGIMYYVYNALYLSSGNAAIVQRFFTREKKYKCLILNEKIG